MTTTPIFEQLTVRNIEPTQINNIHVVYGHMDAEDLALKYIGCVPFNKLTDFEDARSNSLWPSIFLLPGKSLHMHVYSMHATEADARRAQHALISEYKPVCNMRGRYVPAHHQAVVCNETRERWTTVKEAARAHNIAESALSNHLRGKVGHVTVKGRTYRREV